MQDNDKKVSAGRGWLARLVRPRRKVWLIMHDGDMQIATATKNEAGWFARWIKNADQWSQLLPDGSVRGTGLVKGWRPHTGWSGDDFFQSNKEDYRGMSAANGVDSSDSLCLRSTQKNNELE
jgi:hypothetical protein